MLHSGEWTLLGAAFAAFLVFAVVIDSMHGWQLAIGIDRAARRWLHSSVCDRASMDVHEEVQP